MPNPLRRRSFHALVATGVAMTWEAGWGALSVSGAWAQSKLEKSQLNLAVGSRSGFDVLPLTLAQQLGYFSAEGLQVSLLEQGSEARVTQALQQGAADVGAGPFEQTLHLQAQGWPVLALVQQARAPQIAVGVSTRRVAHDQVLHALRGGKVGVSALGEASHRVASLLLLRAGLGSQDMLYLGVGMSAGALTALRSGQVDAISTAEPVMTMLEQKGDVKLLGDTRTLKGTQELFGGAMPGTCLYASAAFVQKHPNTCQALANAVVRALKWLQTAAPSDILKTVPEAHMLGDRALYLAVFEKLRDSFSPDGLVPTEAPRTAWAALAAVQPSWHPERVDLNRLYTNEFARRAKERFRA